MKTQNLTSFSEFHLLGFSEDPELQLILFGLFLSIYLVTVLGNLLIILAVISDSHLHTPMYFFLSNLSFSDICFISTTVPKMIVGILTQNRAISYVGCLTQMSFYILFLCMDHMLLTVMGYDRFLAICYPLHYSITMNPCFSVSLLLVSFLVSILDSQTHNMIALQITCFKDVEFANFFCEPSQIFNHTCSDPFTNTILMYLFIFIFGFFPISWNLYSYYKILSSLLKVPSSGGRHKAFSTCGSHLSVVCLFYGTGIGVYFGSAVLQSPRKCMVASLMYTVVTPMLNPFIYSLRNRDMHSALTRFYRRTV
ncbi:olfactory receptor 7E24-like [Fukomys damarensis]|uniref:olfactory receptor 7E24-like n=1 Tax=Fukomys damarensis TaxID=885580 RepID=UPI0005400FB6|nr:olfactory receptor 7E24-like [Fukomys damarensis]